jgi:hypothetical protein
VASVSGRGLQSSVFARIPSAAIRFRPVAFSRISASRRAPAPFVSTTAILFPAKGAFVSKLLLMDGYNRFWMNVLDACTNTGTEVA